MPTSVGDMTVPSPQSYLLDKDGRKTVINITYKLTGKNTLTFNIPAYDKSKTLVIDPIVMRWATMVSNNASADSHCHGLDVDASGNIFITGKYQSGLITVGPFQAAVSGSYDLFIGKYQEPATPGNAGTRVWQTYLGTSSSDNPYALDAGLDGNVYIAGVTSGNFSKAVGTGFTAGSWTQRTATGIGGQVFIAKINAAGTGALIREIGTVSNNLTPNLFDLRVLPTGSGNFDLIATGFVTQQSGTSADGDVPAPLRPSGVAISSGSGNTNGYIFRITSDLATIKWAEQYGTGSSTNEFTIAVADNSGNILVGGLTNSSSNVSYNNPSSQNTLTGNQDGWLLSLNATSGVANWSRYYNSANNKSTSILCIEVNTAVSQVFIGGLTGGLAGGNITTGAYQTTYGGGTHDFFVASLPIGGA